VGAESPVTSCDLGLFATSGRIAITTPAGTVTMNGWFTIK